MSGCLLLGFAVCFLGLQSVIQLLFGWLGLLFAGVFSNCFLALQRFIKLLVGWRGFVLVPILAFLSGLLTLKCVVINLLLL